MYIEELIIDGFKSYATRTTISGWDMEFNAITGLNGSGKSNILDAICFALGIQSTTSLRANNLQELIYKKGQAGVQRASVTIMFNNEDREKSPIGYEEHKKISVCRQIMVGGKNKYFINSLVATHQKVASLFQSVSLNINNPHFLIMQGKITKVLNMKPQEILAMIEEAAGTRMFEERKEKALDTIAKKESKLTEITDMLETGIIPRLNKLRDQKRSFLEFKKIESELDHLNNMVVAYDFYTYQEKLEKSSNLKETKLAVMDSLKSDISTLNQEISQINETVSQILSQKETMGSSFVALEAEFKTVSKELVRMSTQVELKGQSVKEEENGLESLEDSLKEAEQQVVDCKANLAKLAQEFESARAEHESKTVFIKKQEELLQTLTTGMSASEGHENGYMDQLQDAKKQESQFQAQIQQGKLRLTHMKKELSESMPKAKRAEKEHASLISEMERTKNDVERLQQTLESIDYDPRREAELQHEKETYQEAVADLERKLDFLNRELSSVNFTYSDPAPKFDRSKVKGLVAELFNIPKDNLGSAGALEVCAGGRLYNVVVESEVVGSQLLKNGRLRKRVTIIPLNKINAFKARAETLATVNQVAPGKADLALKLIGFEDEVSKAMEYVFGNTLICTDAVAAKEVTFHPNIRMKSVTLDGDIYDPAGSLSGGSKAQNSGILLKLRNKKQLMEQVNEKQALLDDIAKTLENYQRQLQKYNKTKQALDLKQHALKLLEEQLSSNSSAKVIRLVQELHEGVSQIDVEIKELEAKKRECIERQKSLEKEMEELSQHRESKLKAIQKELDKCKKEVAKATPFIKTKQQEVDIASEEIRQSEQEVNKILTQLETVKVTVRDLRSELKSLENESALVKKQFEKVDSALQAERKHLSHFDSKVKALEKDRKMKKEMMHEAELQWNRLSLELNQFEKDKAETEARARELLARNPWIKDQRQNFGVSDTQFDFSKIDVKNSKDRQRMLQEKYNSMRKNVKTDVLQDIDRLEKKETMLTTKLKTVKKDKKKIETTIEELDKYKREALNKTWVKVNSDFGGIFGDLLPGGNTAKLVPPEGQDITQGLEVKVSLGGVWKNSLTELSGGQRSLIALSLIMSLLQFKPAPMYILDEIDAALDLSHTQNIGVLFKNRFKGSQFIVVSLKEGMFTNANVLFKAKFRDGISAVDRIAQQKQLRDKENHATTTKKFSANRRESVAGLRVANI